MAPSPVTDEMAPREVEAQHEVGTVTIAVAQSPLTKCCLSREDSVDDLSTRSESISCSRRGSLDRRPRGIDAGEVGREGRVRRAMEVSTGQIFAIKSFDVQRDNDEHVHFVSDVEVEIQRWKVLEHPNLVQILGFESTPQQLHIHLEYMAMGSMSTFLEEFGPLCGKVLRLAAQGVASGLDFLHTQSPPVVHGGLRGANLLIDEGMHIKLADSASPKLAAWASTGNISSLAWTAPEVARGSTAATVESDLWSLGCTLIELATAERPWGDRAALDAVLAALTADAGAAPQVPPEMPPELQDLARGCLRRCAAERLRTDELLRHSYFAVGSA